jgi:large subunit ribosomal protein L15
VTELTKLTKTTKRSRKRRGRGYGSGKGGHTTGRGAKGLKARGKVKLTFEGTKIKKSLWQRLPLRRGKDKFKSAKPGPVAVNLKYLGVFEKKQKVDLDSLIKKGIVDPKEAKKWGVKILGDGEIKTSLVVALPTSKGAARKIKNRPCSCSWC